MSATVSWSTPPTPEERTEFQKTKSGRAIIAHKDSYQAPFKNIWILSIMGVIAIGGFAAAAFSLHSSDATSYIAALAPIAILGIFLLYRAWQNSRKYLLVNEQIKTGVITGLKELLGRHEAEQLEQKFPRKY